MNRQNTFLTAFKLTLPVMAGYLFLGLAYGVLMQSIGYSASWVFIFSVLIYGGSIQFLGVALLSAQFDPLHALILTLMVSARHVFYGLSTLERLEDCGRYKPFIIFGLTDETYSIICSAEVPKDADKGFFYFIISALDHCYWVISGVLGCLLGAALRISTAGLDFALTSLFIVIFLGQWQVKTNRPSSLAGLICSGIALILFGGQSFIIPAMLLILATLWFMARVSGARSVRNDEF